MGQPRLFSLIDKAIFDYKMIEEGDKILIGASGGKDSTALVDYFANRAKRPDANFTFHCLHIQNDFAPDAFSPQLEKIMADWGVSLEKLPVDVLGRVKEGRKMNCYWCSTQRRKELLNYALEKGFNKLVLGHHMDDILETLLMNMLRKGILSTMTPRFQYEKYPLTVIRPLCYADLDIIKAHADQRGYHSTTCTCDYQDNSDRKAARSKLEVLTEGDRRMKVRLFDSLRNIHEDYLP